MPIMKGYINEQGVLNLERLQIFFNKLAEEEEKRFANNDRVFEIKESDILNYVISLNDTTLKDTTVDLTINNDTSSSIYTTAETSFDQSNEEAKNRFLNRNEFERTKRMYYKKLELKTIDQDSLNALTISFIEALQWNLFYYYIGCQDWRWYYSYHYAPYVSDMIKLDFKELKFNFDYNNKPLLPFEQLLAVLPAASKHFLPASYQNAMCSKELIDYYPTEFKLDLNGKKQIWEAIILIPFIEGKKLQKASAIANQNLTEEEIQRNKHGPHLIYEFVEELQPVYYSSLVDVFSNIKNNHAKCSEFYLPTKRIKQGISGEIKLQTHFYGFPSLKFLKFTAKIKNEKVRIFDRVSKLDNCILKLDDTLKNQSCDNLIKYLEKDVNFNYPYPKECKLISVFDGDFMYRLQRIGNQSILIKEVPKKKDIDNYFNKIEKIKFFLLSRLGILVGDDCSLCFIKPMIGHSFRVAKNGKIIKEKQYSTLQCCVLNKTIMTSLKIVSFKSSTISFKAKDVFKRGMICFSLNSRYYGAICEILNFDANKNTVKLRIELSNEPDLSEIIGHETEILNENYIGFHQLAKKLKLSPIHLARITGSVFASRENYFFKNNISLNLIFKVR